MKSYSFKNLLLQVIFLALLINPSHSFAQRAQRIIMGARPLGMGETFTAIADDNNALFWNPAGLPYIGHHEAATSYADPFGIGIKHNAIGYVFPVKDTYAFGFDWKHIGFEDYELGYSRNNFRLSYGHKLWKGISVGAGLKYLTTDMTLDSNSLGKGSGWGMDLSLLYSPLKKLSLGVVVRDVTNTKLEYDGGGTEVIAPRWYSFGAAFKPIDDMVLAMDLDDERLHLGGEYWVKKILGLRFGIQDDLYTDEPMTFSFGTSVRYKLFQFDYAYVLPPTLPAAHHFSLSLFFDLYPSRVRITDAKVDNLFPSIHKYYSTHPIGKIKCINNDEKPHQTTVSFFIPKLMDAPTEQQVIFRPKETKELDINGVFSVDITNLTEDIMTQAEVKVSYTTEQKTRSHKKTVGLFVYNRNATRWDDLKKAAAFITSTDPVIDEFARPVLVTHEEELKALGRASRNVLRSMVLFNAVSQHGVRYISDPNNPFSRMSADRSAVDNIQYPAEVLRKKSGDCDDLTVLYCSLLENVGISTALIDAPGHIFMMFDSGVSTEKSLRFPVDKSMYIVRDGNIWIPCEVTKIGESFIEAWQLGAEECLGLAKSGQFRIIKTSDAWQEYEPSPPKFSWSIAPPDKQVLKNKFGNDQSEMKDIMNAYIHRKYIEPLNENPDNHDLRFELAQVYVAIREYVLSISEYQRLIERNIDPARSYNNIGIAFFLKSEIKQAAQNFKKAMDLEPDDEGIQKNLELALAALNSEERIAVAREIGISLPDGLKAVEFEIDDESFNWK